MKWALWKPLRHRDLRLLVGGQSVSWIGNNFYEISIMWLVLNLTGSTAAMAGVAAVSTIPQLIFAPLAGVVADRVNRRILSLSMDLARGLVVLILPTLSVLHHLAVWHIYVIAFILFTLSTFFLPARQAILPNLVTDEELPAANALFQTVLNVSLLLGFGLGGIVVAWIGVVPALYLDSLSFAASVLSLFFMRSSGSSAVVRRTKQRASAMKEALLGIQFVWVQPSLLAIFAFTGCISLLVGPLLILPAPFSRDVLHAGATGYGLMEGSFMAGNLGGALLAPLSSQIKRIGLLLIGVVVGAGVLLSGMSFMTMLIPAMSFYLAVGLVAGSVNIPLITMIQRMTPDDMRGRVMSTLMIINTAGIPLSLSAAGFLTQRVGIAPMYRLVGVLFVFLGLVSLITPLARVSATGTPVDDRELPAGALVHDSLQPAPVE